MDDGLRPDPQGDHAVRPGGAFSAAVRRPAASRYASPTTLRVVPPSLPRAARRSGGEPVPSEAREGPPEGRWRGRRPPACLAVTRCERRGGRGRSEVRWCPPLIAWSEQNMNIGSSSPRRSSPVERPQSTSCCRSRSRPWTPRLDGRRPWPTERTRGEACLHAEGTVPALQRHLPATMVAPSKRNPVSVFRHRQNDRDRSDPPN